MSICPSRHDDDVNTVVDEAMKPAGANRGYPWFFREVKHFFKTETYLSPPSMEERLARRHLQMAIDWKGEQLGVFETRRHYTNYFKGIPDLRNIG